MRCRHAGFALCAVLLLACQMAVAQGPGSGAKTQRAPRLLGTWRGESKCLVKPSACHDEDALYRISAGPSPDQVHVSANKVVEGKEINMGGSDCAYDAAADSVNCALPNGNAVRLKRSGDALEGTMTLKDGTAWRRISLHRADEK